MVSNSDLQRQIFELKARIDILEEYALREFYNFEFVKPIALKDRRYREGKL